MSMMDIGIPSGMTPDMDTLDTSKAPMYKRSEMGYRKLSLYFDEVTERCFMLLNFFMTVEIFQHRKEIEMCNNVDPIVCYFDLILVLSTVWFAGSVCLHLHGQHRQGGREAAVGHQTLRLLRTQ